MNGGGDSPPGSWRSAVPVGLRWVVVDGLGRLLWEGPDSQGRPGGRPL